MRPENPLRLHEGLRTAREQSGRSISSVARGAGISPTALGKVESGVANIGMGAFENVVNELGFFLGEFLATPGLGTPGALDEDMTRIQSALSKLPPHVRQSLMKSFWHTVEAVRITGEGNTG